MKNANVFINKSFSITAKFHQGAEKAPSVQNVSSLCPRPREGQHNPQFTAVFSLQFLCRGGEGWLPWEATEKQQRKQGQKHEANNSKPFHRFLF